MIGGEPEVAFRFTNRRAAADAVKMLLDHPRVGTVDAWVFPGYVVVRTDGDLVTAYLLAVRAVGSYSGKGAVVFQGVLGTGCKHYTAQSAVAVGVLGWTEAYLGRLACRRFRASPSRPRRKRQTVLRSA